MKYKRKAQSTLQTIENRLEVLGNILEYNKPILREDFVRGMAEVRKLVEQVSEMVDLEYDDITSINTG